jgi:signal transduction histidine kinase
MKNSDHKETISWEKKYKELVKQQHRLMRAISIRNDFMSIASHELKTPITSIKMYAQYLKRMVHASFDQKMIEYFERMDAQVDKISELISDLLDVSRIEHGKFTVTMGVFSLDDEVRQTVQICQTTTDQQIKILGHIGRNVKGDRAKISQVLINLINNAIRYSPEADKIIVKLAPHAEGAFVTIQDFGIGIDKGDIDKLFEPFYRSAGAEKETKSSPGLGIGLYVASQIIQKHGSRITVESEKGKGSKFSFTLPYA